MQLGIYIHFPYCLSKCPYCDFASRAEAVIPQERYTEAVLRELRARAAQFAEPSREAVSIYFGGGTPSLWDPPQVGRVLAACRDLFDVREGAEITLEANPGTTDEGRFTAFRKLGVNRLSIGVQSFADSQLLVLGRKHSACEAERAFRTARAAGFENVSLDLIHGGSGHTIQAAARDAASAVALGPEHVSAYALTLIGLAEDVPMAKAVRRERSCCRRRTSKPRWARRSGASSPGADMPGTRSQISPAQASRPCTIRSTGAGSNTSPRAAARAASSACATARSSRAAT
jgi:oxygen-independent coproporphyrinogen-3 oxidase